MTTMIEPPASRPAAERLRTGGVLRLMLRKFGALLALALVFGLFAILRPATFPTLDNLQIMALQTAVIGTAALGMTLNGASGETYEAAGVSITAAVRRSSGM